MTINHEFTNFFVPQRTEKYSKIAIFKRNWYFGKYISNTLNYEQYVYQKGIWTISALQHTNMVISILKSKRTSLPSLKGQLISKCLFGIFNSPKKRTKKFNFTTMVPQVELFSFVFWENWRHQKDISKLTDL